MALSAVALLLLAPMMNANPAPDKDGHVLTALWKQYEEARQAVQMALQLAQTLSGQTSRSASADKPVPPLVFIGGSAFVVAEALPLFH